MVISLRDNIRDETNEMILKEKTMVTLKLKLKETKAMHKTQSIKLKTNNCCIL